MAHCLCAVPVVPVHGAAQQANQIAQVKAVPNFGAAGVIPLVLLVSVAKNKPNCHRPGNVARLGACSICAMHCGHQSWCM